MGGGLAHRRTVGRNARGGSKTTVVPPYRLTAFALLTVLACAGPRQDVDPAPVEADGFSLVLNNRHLLDVNVFVQHDGQSDRVATVVASTSRTMVLPTWMLGNRRLSD